MPTQEQKIAIDRAVAKDELARINPHLPTPHILIGGLAVERYHTPRMSKDIDLICDFKIAQNLLEKLYPTIHWCCEDKNNNEYRPGYHIKHRHNSQKSEIIFGPKITERGMYKYLDWSDLAEDAQPFVHNEKTLTNILVPLPHALAYSKLVSVVGREETHEEKIQRDLNDFSNLTNHELFSLAKFWNLLNRYDTSGELRREFKNRSNKFPDALKGSCLHELAKLFLGLESLKREKLATLEANFTNLVRVMVVAKEIEKPEGELADAVERNFKNGVKYLFLISKSNVNKELEKYYHIFAAYQKINNPNEPLLNIKALPFDWNYCPIVFYQCDNEDKLHSAYRGSEVEGIAEYYERLPDEYAHTIAQSLLADAPEDVYPRRNSRLRRVRCRK